MASWKTLMIAWVLTIVRSQAQIKSIALVTLCDDKYAPLATMMIQSARDIGRWTNPIFVFASHNVAQSHISLWCRMGILVRHIPPDSSGIETKERIDPVLFRRLQKLQVFLDEGIREYRSALFIDADARVIGPLAKLATTSLPPSIWIGGVIHLSCKIPGKQDRCHLHQQVDFEYLAKRGLSNSFKRRFPDQAGFHWVSHVMLLNITAIPDTAAVRLAIQTHLHRFGYPYTMGDQAFLKFLFYNHTAGVFEPSFRKYGSVEGTIRHYSHGNLENLLASEEGTTLLERAEATAKPPSGIGQIAYNTTKVQCI